MQLPRFEDLAASADATLDVLALALAAAFRPVDAARALATLDGLGAEVARVLDGSARTPRADALALAHVLRKAQATAFALGPVGAHGLRRGAYVSRLLG